MEGERRIKQQMHVEVFVEVKQKIVTKLARETEEECRVWR